MQEIRTPKQESAEDLFFGQVVVIWARWFVILAGALLAVWSAEDVSELTGTVVLIVALMAMNFVIHGRYLMRKPINRILVIGSSLLDLLIITIIVVAWKGGSGLESPFFVFYYPVLLAFSFVFPVGYAIAFTALGLGAYVAAVLLADPRALVPVQDLELLTTRLITLASMGGLGTYYWRIQRKRRRLAGRIRPAVVGG